MNTSLEKELVCLSSGDWKDARLYNVLTTGSRPDTNRWLDCGCREVVFSRKMMLFHTMHAADNCGTDNWVCGEKSLDSLRNEAEEWKMVEWSLRIPDETRERSKKYCSNRTMGNTTWDKDEIWSRRKTGRRVRRWEEEVRKRMEKWCIVDSGPWTVASVPGRWEASIVPILTLTIKCLTNNWILNIELMVCSIFSSIIGDDFK